MKIPLKVTFYIVLMSTFIPLLILFPLSIVNFFGDNSAVLQFISISSLIPLGFYLFASQKALSDKEEFSIFLRITFYLNFIIFMIAVLIAFNFIIIGGFLFGGDAPIGMDLEASQAPYLVIIGIYLIFASAFGMSYLSRSKKQILS